MNNKISEQEFRFMMDEGKTLYTISRHFNTTIPEIFKLGRSYGIHFAYDHDKIPIPTKQDLESMYHDEGMTQKQIASEFNIHQWTVGRCLRKYNISTVGRNGSKSKVPIPPKEVLERMYIEEHLTQKQIAKEFDVFGANVSKWIRYYNIPTRGPNGTLAVPRPPKDELLNYIAEGLNQHQIAKECKVCDWKIYDWCKHYGIPGMVNNFRCTTPEHYVWRDKVFARDNYICQECGSQYKLQAHHIRPYCDYPELELDVDNGITLCLQCHDNIRGRECQYIVKYEDIVLRDRCIGDDNYEHIN